MDRMIRRDFVRTVGRGIVSAILVALALGIADAGESTRAARPNVVLIISDDHAWTDYRFLGNEKIQSPNIDRLAEEGLTFTRGYVTTALCSPSLATMLTGLYTHQHGITGNDPVRGKDREVWLNRFFENPMLPKLLADAGYNTMHTGKYWMRQPAAAGFTHDNGESGRHGGKSLGIGGTSAEPTQTSLARVCAVAQSAWLFAAFYPVSRMARLFAEAAPWGWTCARASASSDLCVSAPLR